MSNRLIIILGLFIVMLARVASLETLSLANGQEPNNINKPVRLPPPYSTLDEKASAVQGADPGPIGELADAVLLVVTGGNIPTLFVSPYKERLVRAEINYRKGEKPALPEVNVVRVLDELARTLDAPDYARTDEDGVRDTRLAISILSPNLIVRRPSASAGEPSTLSPTMSPIEAFYVTYFLIMQKANNEFFQVSPIERAEIRASIKKLSDTELGLTEHEQGSVTRAIIQQKLHPEKHQFTLEELAIRAKQQNASHEKSQGAFIEMTVASPRYKEMQKVLHRANTLSIADALDLANRCLALLGIDE